MVYPRSVIYDHCLVILKVPLVRAAIIFGVAKKEIIKTGALLTMR
jgi:hypothetical protein